MKFYTLIAALMAILLFGCSESQEAKSGKLSIIDSLGWQDSDEYAFSESTVSRIRDRELFVLDTDTSIFHVYETGSLQFKRTFGGSGRAPGEFMFPNSFTFDREGNIVVADFANSRLQWITQEGDFVKAINFHPLGKVYNFNDTIFASTAHFAPDYKLVKINGTAIDSVSSLDEVCRKMDLHDEGKHLEIVRMGNRMAAFPVNSVGELYLYNGSRIVNTISGNESVEKEYSKSSNAVIDEKGFWIVERTFSEKPKSSDKLKTITRMKDVYNIREYLRLYSFDGILLEQYKLPDRMMTLQGETLAMSDSMIFVTNYDGIIYKLKMED